MARLDLGGRIMLAIGAGTVFAAACGQVEMSGSGSGGGSPMADGGDERADDAAGNGGVPADAGPKDAADDALDATSADGDGWACVPAGGSCTQEGECCGGSHCLGMQCI